MIDVPEPQLLRRGAVPRERGTGSRLLIRGIVTNRALVWELARRELTASHAGQAAGIIWLAIHPITLFLVYALLFTLVFQVRIGDRGPSDYLIYIFAGLAPWLLTQDVLVRATGAMVNNRDIVKKVMFPAEVLAAKTLVASLTVQSILMVAVILYTLVARGTISSMLLMLPALLLLHLILLWGLALLLSALTPYFRDIPELIRVFVVVNIYLMPVLYPPDLAPAGLRAVIVANPFSHLIWCYQDVLYFGFFAHPISWVVLTTTAGAALLVGSYVFLRLRHHFGSIL
jgi:lipopolysaccharide transport system permease protein